MLERLSGDSLGHYRGRYVGAELTEGFAVKISNALSLPLGRGIEGEGTHGSMLGVLKCSIFWSGWDYRDIYLCQMY